MDDLSETINSERLYLPNERKKITEKLKCSKNVSWFRDLIRKSCPSSLLYLSEPLTECFKSTKIALSPSVVDLLVASLDSNCQYVLQRGSSSPSLYEIGFLGTSCLGLHLFLKSKLVASFDLRSLKTTPDAMVAFTVTAQYIPRDTLNLIMPLIIFMKNSQERNSIELVYSLGKQSFSENDYLQACWNNCLLKTCKLRETDSELLKTLLLECVDKIGNSVLWYQFVYLDTIRTVMKKHKACFLETKETTQKIFQLMTLYCDDRGLSVSKVCEDILLMCLQLEPDLLQTVEKLSERPWYSRKTLIFRNLLISKSKLTETATTAILVDLVRHLGYNRLDHCSLKAIKTLLSRNLVKTNFINLLESCVACAGENPNVIRILSRYTGPYFTKQVLFPDDLKDWLMKMLDSSSVSDQGKMFLVEIFYLFFKQEVLGKLLSSKLNKSSCTEVQSSLIMLVSRNILDFSNSDYIITIYQHLLTIPCPTVRLHAVASFQGFKPLARIKSPLLQSLAEVFCNNIYVEAPYHSLVTALNFFSVIISNIGTELFTEERMETILNKTTNLFDHTDTEISSLAKQIVRKLRPQSEETCHDGSQQMLPPFRSFMEEAAKIKGLQTIVHVDIPNSVNLLKHQLADMPTENITEVTKTSVFLTSILLDMISQTSSKSEQFYSAPSFEETFVIIQSAVKGDEGLCKEIGKCVWAAIASLLELLGSLSGMLVDLTMQGYLGNGDVFTEKLYSIGDICLKCVFRCRHRSVINAACDTLKKVSVLTSPHPPTHNLPSRWVNTLLNVLCSTTSSSLSRRSAGLPEAIEALLQCNILPLTHRTVVKLLETANIPYPRNCDETEDLVQVHSLHMLRLVLSSAKLRHHLIPFADQICKLCYSGFVHSFWVVRNASFLLFAEMVNYILGHLNTEYSCGYRSNLSISELRQHYSGIYVQVLSNLQLHSSRSTSRTCPTIFLSLMICSKLYPDPGDEDTTLSKCLYALLSSPIYKIRSVTARTLVLVSQRTRSEQLVREILSELGPGAEQNKVNGVLMFLLECCKEGLVESDVLKEIFDKVDVDKLLSINLSLFLQICVEERLRGVPNDFFSRKIIEISQQARSPGYPSYVLDYIGVWFVVNKDIPSVFNHIHAHSHQLSEVFWDSLDRDFYLATTGEEIKLFLKALTKPESQFVTDYLANCLFNSLNHRFSHELIISDEILNFLSTNHSKFVPLCLLLALTYNILVNKNSLQNSICQNMPFHRSDPLLLSRLFKIRVCQYNASLKANLLACALLHCQSENEEVRELACQFCIRISENRLLDEKSSYVEDRVSGKIGPVTARHALESVSDYLKGLIREENCDAHFFIDAIREVRAIVICNDAKGFDIHSNAHFDKKMFLDLVNV